ncbi:MAG: hypothetical protein K2M64_02430, partial [Clostridia bacterium]|nr:hypothetical protein [Clostridia bacterium]
VMYSGTTNKNETYQSSSILPTQAGNYSASVAGDTDNKNFELVANDTVTFVIEKFVLDSSLIEIPNQMYNGTPRKPDIKDETYNGNGTIYTVHYTLADLVDAGKHDIKLTLTDEYNYAWNKLDNASKDQIIYFVIAGADIYAIPYGTMVYGDTNVYVKLQIKFVYAGGVDAGQSADNDVEIDDEKLQFLFGADKTVVDKTHTDISKLTVGDYVVTLLTENGFVVGVKSTNHNYANISLKLDDTENVFTVTARAIRLIADDSSSVYNQDVDLATTFTFAEGSALAAWDDVSQIGYKPTTTATKGSPVKTYDVTATATLDNYVITVEKGTHTISALQVAVKVVATGSVYAGKTQSNVNVVVNILSATNVPNYVFGAGELDDKFTVIYNGTANDGTTYPNSATKPCLAGNYTATVTGITDTNYVLDTTNQSTLSATFEITKATLTLTPNGTITYGQEFAKGQFGYELTGFKSGDNESDVTESGITYKLVKAEDRLVVKDYALTTETDNRYVTGISAYNYNIIVAEGKLTVNKLAITIQPDSTQSVYTQDIDLAKTYHLVGDSKFAYEDSFDSIKFTAVLKDVINGIGDYKVTANNVQSDNYDVKVEDGIHTVNPIKVGIAIRAINGVYGSDNSNLVSFMGIYATNLGELQPIAEGLLEFTFNYSGKSNSGVTHNSSTVPTLAGVYTVKVTGITDTNYVIDYAYEDGIESAGLEIAKKAVDAKRIVAQSVSYTGNAVKPQIVDNYYNTNGNEVYTVSYGANNFVNVGVYTLTLTLKDTNNYCWLDNLNPTDTITFEITKANNAVVDASGNVVPNGVVEISDWTIDDEASKPQIKLLNGQNDVVFEYAMSKDGFYSAEVPANAGTYWVRAVVSESANYNAFVSEAVSFVIKKHVITVPTAHGNANGVYSGQMQTFVIDNYDDKVMSLDCDLFSRITDNTLTLSALNAGTYTAVLSLRNVNNYEWQDNRTKNEVVITWVIEKQTLPRLHDAESKFLVNGNQVTFIPEGFDSRIMTIEGNVNNREGLYTAIITLTDTDNYAWEGTTNTFITVSYELTGTNTVFIVLISIAGGLCAGLAIMAIILPLVFRRKRRKEEEAIDARSRADGWNE